MEGMSERQYAAHVGLSRGAIQKAKAAERLVLFSDGSIDAIASNSRRAETTDPSKTRKVPAPKLKPVPEAAVAAVGDTLREQGLAAPGVGGGTTFLQALGGEAGLRPLSTFIRSNGSNDRFATVSKSISRRRSASGAFSTKSRKFIIPAVIGGIPGPGWCRQPDPTGTSPVSASARTYTT